MKSKIKETKVKKIPKINLGFIYMSIRTWREFEATLDKENIEFLEIPREIIFESKSELIEGDSQISFADNKLVIKGFPKLKVLHANNCNLTSVDIDCPSLETLNLNNNKLETFDPTGTPNLKVLMENW